MRLSPDVPSWDGDLSQPRDLGHFMLAIDPASFIPREAFDAAMQGYLARLRAVEPQDGQEPPMAPGDREWRIRDERCRRGVPIDPDSAEAFAALAQRLGAESPFAELRADG